MVSGKAMLKLTSADLTGAFNKLTVQGFELSQIVYLDEISAHLIVNTAVLKHLCIELDRIGVKYSVIRRNGIRLTLSSVIHRPILSVLIAMLILLTLVLPGKVLFIRVEGNRRVSTNEVLENAQECGIVFGASAAKVRSEHVKNALLSKMDDLQWAAVNIKGCVAVISVKEKECINYAESLSEQGSSIVASIDGILLDVIATSGQSRCVSGQAVKKGQVLISGYVNYGNILKICNAEGEVYALTKRNLEIISPQNYSSRRNVLHTVTKFSVRIGKKLINLSESGGIYPGSCVKIYSEKQLRLSSANHLPVTLIKETVIYYDTVVLSTTNDPHTHDFVEQYAKTHILDQMIAGFVKNEEFSFTCTQFACKMKGNYICEEMIGRTVYHKK